MPNPRGGMLRPNNPAMYPQWTQRLSRRMMQLSNRPGKYIIEFTVHEDGRKVLNLHERQRDEQLGQ